MIYIQEQDQGNIHDIIDIGYARKRKCWGWGGEAKGQTCPRRASRAGSGMARNAWFFKGLQQKGRIFPGALRAPSRICQEMQGFIRVWGKRAEFSYVKGCRHPVMLSSFTKPSKRLEAPSPARLLQGRSTSWLDAPGFYLGGSFWGRKISWYRNIFVI